MPQIFKFGGYIIFFWSNENRPTEPIHVHIAENNPRANSTKVWITKRGSIKCGTNIIRWSKVKWFFHYETQF